MSYSQSGRAMTQRVLALMAAHPEMPLAEIAARAGCKIDRVYGIRSQERRRLGGHRIAAAECPVHGNLRAAAADLASPRSPVRVELPSRTRLALERAGLPFGLSIATCAERVLDILADEPVILANLLDGGAE